MRERIKEYFTIDRQKLVFAFLVGALFALEVCRGSLPVQQYHEEVARETAAESVVIHPPEALAIARVLYGVRDYQLTDKAKIAVIEVILNRANDTSREFRTYNTIIEVCEQPNQWQGYNPTGEYFGDDLELIEARLADTSGARVIPSDCYFLTVSKNTVSVRTDWSGGNEWKVS